MTKNQFFGQAVDMAIQTKISFVVFFLIAGIAQAEPLGKDSAPVEAAVALSGGIIVVLDPTDSESLLNLASQQSLQVQALLDEESELVPLRESIHETGKYGQISVNPFNGSELPYIDNLLNLVICDQNTSVPRDEMMRVLAPRGVLFVKKNDGFEKIVKPVPKGMDEWNQFLHNADNNGVSRDDVGPPQRMRWHNTPETGRAKALMPSVTCMVTANGVLFTVEDRASPEDVNAPFEYHLVARDAFNGVELWKRPVKEWVKGGGTTSIKSVSTQLQRRLVAIDDYVYFTMGFDDPISKIHGRSGKVERLLPGTESTREVAVENGIIYGIQGPGYGLITEEAAREKRRTADTKAPELNNTLYAYDLGTDKMLWSVPLKHGYIGGSVCVNKSVIAYMAASKVVCLEKEAGTEKWESSVELSSGKPKRAKAKSKNKTKGSKTSGTLGEDYNIHPTLVLAPNKAFCAHGNEIVAFALKTGEKLWTCPNGENYMKSPELFIAKGLLWSKQLKGINTNTGKVVKELTQEMLGPMSHDRCYRNRVTHQYYLNSGSGGIDFVGLDGNSEYPNPWVRSTCGLSAMPANGMIYNGPFVCQCAIGSMLTGFNALYNEAPGRYTVTHSPKLIEGSAFERPLGKDSSDLDWPGYRHSGSRSGISPAILPSRIAEKWLVKIGSNPTAPVIVGDHIYVAARDEHTLYCLDKSTGKTVWRFTAGGPIDSPPTYYKGLLFTGCRDGWVYCVDANDGALRWRFNALPSQSLIVDRGQLESAWPVNGSILVENEIAYFAAGRSSYLDGGVSVFGLKPETGEMIHNKVVAGPYEKDKDTFPTRGLRTFRLTGFKSGIFSVSDGKLFLRQQAFNPDLTPVSMEAISEPHLIPSHGFLDSVPQHRTYWTVDVDLSYGGPSAVTGYGPLGDTTAFADGEFFEIRGYSPGRNLPKRGANATPFNTHSVFAGKMTQAKEGEVWISRKGKTIPEVGTWEKKWSMATPFAGHAISVCKNAVIVAGVPMTEGFTQKDTIDSFRGEKGGVLWMMNKATGERLQEFTLPAPPAWDSIAIASGTCVLSLKDGSVMGFSAE